VTVATPGHRRGSVTFGVLWFCLFLPPLIMILISASLVSLYFIDFPLSRETFHLTHGEIHLAILFAYIWLAASMPVAWTARLLEPKWAGRYLSPAIVYIVGCGPLLGGVTFNSYVNELRGAAMTWDKSEKTGKVGMPAWRSST
jgi:hypothetical protein